MGVWTGLCIFDYSAFTQTVIPALQSGENHPLVWRTIELLNISNSRFDTPGDDTQALDFRGLDRAISMCDSDAISCSLGKNFRIHNGEIIAPNEVKIARDDYWNYEDFVDLFEWVVSRHAISHFYVFGKYPRFFEELFGRSEWSSSYREEFDSNQDVLGLLLEFERLIYPLLDSLDRNGSYWAHGNGGYGEGIRGWLDPEDTKTLLGIIDTFLFCNRDPVLPELSNFQQLYREYYEDYLHEKHWHKLEVFKKIVTMAVELDRGLLWGRDLGLFYDDISFDEYEKKPIDLWEILEQR
jgi:hypothetical protein